MVVPRRTLQIAIPTRMNNQKGFLKTAFTSALLIYPLNLDAIPDSYVAPIIYLFLISLINTTLFMGKLAGSALLKDNIQHALIAFSYSLVMTFIAECLLCFLFSFFSSKIISQEHTSKQFGLNASSFTYIPVALLLTLIEPQILGWIGSFGAVLLMSYYLQATYSTYFPYTSQRIQVIHQIYIFLIYYLVVFASLIIPGKVFEHILKQDQ
ncbi:uncharacterized protein VICG_01984 [Vittaforma corneae ATCC 50505]|uniref:Uncharacterized protein n=1 Tax=Vittaforma corneae (strain ATCC 50505) TaxID=993615 RepID=L2GJZ0_VITCO|nr:uncharacterized protein VICG_01984 [Vittaforma corneae ATCC 50505]ELA40954.1 hypothetical protein VICG_01984 [Vittaforma corneae ATCC 50505]